MPDDADIVESALANLLEQGTDAGLMHFAADEINLGQLLRDLRRRVTHAKTDFEHQRRLATKDRQRIEQAGLERQHITRRELIKRALLPRAHAAGTDDIALDRAALGYDFGFRHKEADYQG